MGRLRNFSGFFGWFLGAFRVGRGQFGFLVLISIGLNFINWVIFFH